MSKKHKSKGHKRSQHKPTIPRYNPHPPQPIAEKREISPAGDGWFNGADLSVYS